MKKYRAFASRPMAVAYDDGVDYYEPNAVSDVTVYESEDKWQFTGIYNEVGEPMYSCVSQPIGFMRGDDDI